MRKALIIAGNLVLALFSISVLALLALAGWLYWHFNYAIGLPSESQLAALPTTGPACSSGDAGTYVPLVAIPPLVRKAVLAHEDPDFYDRPERGPATAYILAVLANHRPSWSNISASVARSCWSALDPECCKGPSLDRSFGELFFRGRVERALSRDRILEIYLNEMYLGRGAYGVAAAATAYFGKPLGELDVSEIALIATRFRGPNYRFDAFRQNLTIDRMLEAGVITEAEADTAKARPVVLKEKTNGGRGQ